MKLTQSNNGTGNEVPEIAARLTPLLETFVKEEQLMIPVTLSAKGASDEAQDWVRDWSEKETEWNLLLAVNQSSTKKSSMKYGIKSAYVLSVIIVSTFFILMIAFSSLLIPVKAILMNIIGLSATFGILVYIFQYGHFGIPQEQLR